MTETHRADQIIGFDNTDPTIAASLFDTLSTIREQSPVAWTDKVGGFWMLTKYADITAAANDWESFTVEQGHTIPATGKSVMLPPSEVDPPVHTAWRRFVQPYFTPKAIEAWVPQIKQIIAEAFADLEAKGSGDILLEVAHRVPTSVISAILGFTQDWNYISDIVDEWLAGATDIANQERARTAAAAVEAVVREEIDKRVGKPATDILGQIVNGTVDGHPPADHELMGLTITFFVAGHGTTVDGIVNTVRRVLTEPGLFDRLKEDRSKLSAVIDESLRINPPVWNMGRTARKDAEVRGVHIAPGEKVMLTFGAGNYDPDRFEDPTTFNPDRPGVHGHLAFGFGRHRCIGEPLAKKEIQLVLEHILDHIPDLALDADPASLEARTTFSTYGLKSLPVRRISARA